MDRLLLLIDQRGKKYLVKGGQTLQTDLGVFKIPPATEIPAFVESHMGKGGVVLEPSVRDYVECMDRRTSIPGEKDIGLVLAHTGIRTGDKVLEAGTGSGASAIYFSEAVGPDGVVYSYELREDIYSVAKSNIEGFGCSNVRLFNADLTDAPEDLLVDLVFLDLLSPSQYLEHVVNLLRPGGFFAAFCPFVEDAAQCFRVLRRLGMGELEVVSPTAIRIQVLPHGTRPRTTQNVHTGYLVFGRKILPHD